MKIYISGPISNRPKNEYKEQFAIAEKELIKSGYEVVNPTMYENDTYTYKNYIDFDLTLLMGCDAILMLDGWEESKGARLEKQYAETVGLAIYFCVNN